MPTYKCFVKGKPKVHTSSIEATTEALALMQGAIILNTPIESLELVEERDLTCPRCCYQWRCGGRRKIFVTCPNCVKQVSLAKALRVGL